MFGEPKYKDTEYAWMLMKEFPSGDAFPRNPFTSLYKYMLAFAQELRRIDIQINNLVKESTPESTDELIGEWEIDAGFPDCLDIPTTLSARRAQVLNRLIFPGHLETGWADTGNITAGSPIITGIGDTTDLMIGDAVFASAGFQSGKYIVIDRTASTITLEQNAFKNATGASLTAFFYSAELSERFLKAIALFYGYTITQFTYFDIFLLGPEANDFSEIGNTNNGSPVISSIADTSDISVGDYVSVEKGFPLKEHKVISKDATSITLDVNALSTIASVDLIGFTGKPHGMGDPIGDGLLFLVEMDVSLGSNPDGVLLECLFGKLKHSHINFIYNFS